MSTNLVSNLTSDFPDLQAVINDMVGLKYANAGQICVSPNRVYVQKEVHTTEIAQNALRKTSCTNV